jgi:hypothetical protein
VRLFHGFRSTEARINSGYFNGVINRFIDKG